jgi:hypothetical protein
MSNPTATAEHNEPLTAEDKQLVRPPLVLNERTMGWISLALVLACLGGMAWSWIG